MATICDVDGGTEGVETVTISVRGKAYVVDLCVNELAVIQQWTDAGSDVQRRRPGGGAASPGHSVTTID